MCIKDNIVNGLFITISCFILGETHVLVLDCIPNFIILQQNLFHIFFISFTDTITGL